MVITIESSVEFVKKGGLGCKNTTTLICVTRRMIRAYLNFKQQFDSMSYRLGTSSFKLSSRTSKVMPFGKVYFDPFHVSLRPCGCIYDNKNLKLNFLCVIDRTLLGIKHFSYITQKYPEKVYIYT